MLTTEFPPYDHVVRVLRPIFPQLYEAGSTGLERFKSIRAHAATMHGSVWPGRASSNLLQCEIIQAARDIFEEHQQGVEPVELENMVLFRRGDVIFNIKRNRNGVASNHESRLQTEVRRHRGGALSDDLRANFVFVLFKVDEVIDNLLDMRVVCPKGYHSNAWSHSFSEELAGVQSLIPEERAASETTVAQTTTRIKKKNA